MGGVCRNKFRGRRRAQEERRSSSESGHCCRGKADEGSNDSVGREADKVGGDQKDLKASSRRYRRDANTRLSELSLALKYTHGFRSRRPGRTHSAASERSTFGASAWDWSCHGSGHGGARLDTHLHFGTTWRQYLGEVPILPHEWMVHHPTLGDAEHASGAWTKFAFRVIRF